MSPGVPAGSPPRPRDHWLFASLAPPPIPSSEPPILSGLQLTVCLWGPLAENVVAFWLQTLMKEAQLMVSSLRHGGRRQCCQMVRKQALFISLDSATTLLRDLKKVR